MKEIVLLLHGALGSAAQLSPLLQHLEERYAVHTLNFEGHGGLPLPAAFTINGFVKNVLAYLDEHEIAKTYVFGYSMGGYVALQMAHDYPDRVGKVVTLGTKFSWSPDSAAKEVRMMNPDVIEQKIPHFAETLRSRHAPADWKANMRLTADMMTGLGNGLAMQEEDFRSITHPVLITRGDEDHMVSQEESERIAGWLPLGKYMEVSGCKHPLETVDAGRLASLVREWLK